MKKIFLLSIIIIFFLSCGIEDYVFLPPVPQGNVSTTFNSGATIALPSFDVTEFRYFRNFTIYYRIYISGISYPVVNEENMRDLNPSLSTHYGDFRRIIESDTPTTSSMGRLFNDRNYYSLTVENASIEDILSSRAMGKTITINFLSTNPQTIPHLVIDGQRYNLRRSNGGGLFRPVPEDRYFFNRSELYSSENMDVASNANATGERYTYVSMYIVSSGIDSNFSPVYSLPAFINVFMLPNP